MLRTGGNAWRAAIEGLLGGSFAGCNFWTVTADSLFGREVPPGSTGHDLPQMFHSRQPWIVVCRFGVYQSLGGPMSTSAAIILDAGGAS